MNPFPRSVNKKLKEFGGPANRQRRRSVDVFSPGSFMLLISSLGFFGVYLFVTLSHVAGLETLSYLRLDLATINKAMLVFLVYLSCWFFSYLFALKAFGRPSFTLRERGRRPSAMLSVLLFLTSVVVLYFAYKFHPNAGDRFRSSLTEGTYGKLFFLYTSVVLSLFGLLTNSFFSRIGINGFRGNVGVLPIAWLLAAVSLVFVLEMLGGRGRALFPITLSVLIWNYNVSRLSLTKFLTIACIGLAVAVGLPSLDPATASERTLFSSLWGATSGRNFDSLYNLARIYEWWEEHGAWGFPGQLWIGDIGSDLGVSGLPNTREVVMRDVYGMPEFFAGFPATKPGELLLNLGYFGVPVGAILAGGLSAWLYRRLIVERVLGSMSVVVYGLLLFRLGFASPSGYFFQNLVFSVASLVVAAFIWAFLFGGYRFSWRR